MIFIAYIEEQPSQAVGLSKIDYFIGSENYVNSIDLPTEREAEIKGIIDENYGELIENKCGELYAQAIKWDVKVESVTKKNFAKVKGDILKKIRKCVEGFEEEKGEGISPMGGLPPPVGTKLIAPKERGKKK